MTNKNIKFKPIDHEVEELAGVHLNDPEAILELFSTLQGTHGNLPQSIITDIARAIKIPPSSAFGVASFYSMLNLKEKAEKVIRVCDGPVCWLCGASDTRKEVEKVFSGQPEWKIERTSCLGLCDRAPALLINGQQAGPLTPGDQARMTQGWSGQPRDYSQPRKGETRVMMAFAGIVDPALFRFCPGAWRIPGIAGCAEKQSRGHFKRG